MRTGCSGSGVPLGQGRRRPFTCPTWPSPVTPTRKPAPPLTALSGHARFCTPKRGCRPPGQEPRTTAKRRRRCQVPPPPRAAAPGRRPLRRAHR
jgi:hypothetical protein